MMLAARAQGLGTVLATFNIAQAKSPPVARPAWPMIRLNSVAGNASASQDAAPPRASVAAR